MNKNLLLLAVLAILFVVTGCVNIGSYDVGATEQTSHTFEQGDAETLKADINMGIGELVVGSGANELAEAEFTYNIEDWKPELDYDVKGDNGRLTINQPNNTEINGFPTDDIKYRWDIRFNDNIPTDLNINLGAGESTLNLNGLHLTGLKIGIGAGETDVELDISVVSGIGEIKLSMAE